METFDRKVALGPAGDSELLLFLDLFPEQGVLTGYGFHVELCHRILRLYEAVDLYRFLAFDCASEVFRVKFPAEDHVLERVDSNRVLDRRSLAAGIRIARDEGPDRGECYDGINCRTQQYQYGHDSHEERRPCEVEGDKVLMGLVVYEGKTEGPVFLFSALLCHKFFFISNFALRWIGL